MGFLAVGNGVHQDLQVQSILGHWDTPYSNLDNSPAIDIRRSRTDAWNKSSGTSLWRGRWICRYVFIGIPPNPRVADVFSTAGLGYIKYLAPPEWALRWAESRLNLLSVLPHYVSIDQKTYGRFGVLPSSGHSGGSAATELVGSTQRLGP